MNKLIKLTNDRGEFIYLNEIKEIVEHNDYTTVNGYMIKETAEEVLALIAVSAGVIEITSLQREISEMQNEISNFKKVFGNIDTQFSEIETRLKNFEL